MRHFDFSDGYSYRYVLPKYEIWEVSDPSSARTLGQFSSEKDSRTQMGIWRRREEILREFNSR